MCAFEQKIGNKHFPGIHLPIWHGVATRVTAAASNQALTLPVASLKTVIIAVLKSTMAKAMMWTCKQVFTCPELLSSTLSSFAFPSPHCITSPYKTPWWLWQWCCWWRCGWLWWWWWCHLVSPPYRWGWDRYIWGWVHPLEPPLYHLKIPTNLV